MSATNRSRNHGTQYARSASDCYSTPPAANRSILPHLTSELDGALVLDPCAGTGAILRTVLVFLEQEDLAVEDVRGVELDPERARVCETVGVSCAVGDFLAQSPTYGADARRVIVTNPPYGQAMEFVKQSLEWVGSEGTIAMLLRLNRLEGVKREVFHRAHPSGVFVLARRPSFSGKGTDATSYAWFVWGPGRGGRWWIA